MVYVEREWPLPFVTASENYRLPGSVGIAKFVPDVRVVLRHVSEADCRVPDAVFDSGNQVVRARILINAVGCETGLRECRFERVLVSLVELAPIEGLNHEAGRP